VTRTSLFAGAMVFAVATTASAQAALYSKARSVTERAVAATNAHTASEQHPESKSAAAKPAPAQAQAAQQGAANDGKAAAQSVTKLNIASADTVPPAMIMRESYDYSRDGRRDPFVSLLTTNELRPTMSDLRLTGILFDHSGGHSVATLRDLGTNELYRVAAGSPLGRMRVSAIRVKTVVFTIDEFGTTRQDSLVLGDSTKVRGK
jgi:hypothetical protein